MKRVHCIDADAHYCDGTISSAWFPSQGRIDVSRPLGPMITVQRRE